MQTLLSLSLTLLLTFLAQCRCVSAEQPGGSETADRQPTESTDAANTTDLARQALRSVVVISTPGREANEAGIGTGFVISEDGLIVSNLHVVGEGRPITIETADNRTLPIVEVFASDHTLDLAILRVDTQNQPLPVLPLGESKTLEVGAPVIALGNPLGLKHSVVNGVLSAKRQVDERLMLQVAIPVEPGNSGGPLLNQRGEVIGVVTLKSLVSQNLGFAVQVDDVKVLLENPNPIAWKQWLTIGQLDPLEWTPLFGANWTQRAGRVLVEGAGQGFGGRSLCLWQRPVAQLPLEVAVQVKLDNESGAAGLVFHSDGNHKHYGFYPSNGRLRLSRFDGPNVFSWNVLSEVESEHYQPGQWNHLKVRIEDGKLNCFVNDQLVIQSRDRGYGDGKLGLAKFRETRAEFKRFQVAEQIANSQPSAEDIIRINELVGQIPPLAELQSEDVTPLVETATASQQVLRQRAVELQDRAAELLEMAQDVHIQDIVGQLQKLIEPDPDAFDLLRAALLVAKLDGEDIEIDAYISEVDRMATRIRESLTPEAKSAERQAALNQYLFQKNGYRGRRFDYYQRANSYLNRVIDDRVGLPITLSLLYLELGRRLELDIQGVGLPSHFIVKFTPDEGDAQLIDVFHGAKVMTQDDAARQVQQSAGIQLQDEHLAVVSHRDILYRMLLNLRSLAEQNSDQTAMMRYLTAGLVVRPDEIAQRGVRAVIYFETGRQAAALDDLDWFLENKPPGIDLERIVELRRRFERGR